VQQDTLQSSHFSCFLTFLSGATSVKATSSFRQLYNWQLDSRHSSVYIHSYSKRLVHFFNFLFMSRLDRLRREDDGKNRASKKAQDVEQSLLSRVGFISLKLIASCWFVDISCVTNGLSRFHLWQQMPVCFE
jgi:hypothetical protein